MSNQGKSRQNIDTVLKFYFSKASESKRDENKHIATCNFAAKVPEEEGALTHPTGLTEFCKALTHSSFRTCSPHSKNSDRYS